LEGGKDMPDDLQNISGASTMVIKDPPADLGFILKNDSPFYKPIVNGSNNCQPVVLSPQNVPKQS
jgi:hypothetical protein